VEPQLFDLLVYLVQNRDRVVTKDDLIASIWCGRIVSESTLTSRINAVRKAVGDSDLSQKLVRTIPRKGLRFIGLVHTQSCQERFARTPPCATQHLARLAGKRREHYLEGFRRAELD
jgi:DNA-binding winged helix-turn-helix (wHTH) protein